jgi:hypothetical protein
MYKLTHAESIIRIEDGAVIPEDLENSDYNQYLSWEKDGGVAEEADPLPSDIPSEITMRQCRLALHAAGLLPAVNGVIEAIQGEEGVSARIEWEYAMVVSRTSPLLISMMPYINITNQQLDNLFLAAAQLK